MASSKLISSLYLDGNHDSVDASTKGKTRILPLFQKSLRIDHILPDSTCLPSPKRS